MDSQLIKAINNNNGLYQAIFDHHHLDNQITDEVWYSLEKAPPLFSNIVTRSRAWRPDSIYDQIQAASKNRSWGGWSIKDSYANQDLQEYGFTRLFDAQWIYLQPNKFNSLRPGTLLDYRIVTSPAELDTWRLSWDANEKIGRSIFIDTLLTDPSIILVSGYRITEVVCGCLVNKTEDVLGISNFFAPTDDTTYWSDMLSFIFRSIGYRDIVGYEQNELVDSLRLLGYQSIGKLTVWSTITAS